jgi:predicted NBD/HSP70 family sugar kinase
VSHDAVRRANLSNLLRMVHTSGVVSRAELTARTGLNRSTVADLVRELSQRGLVAEGSPLATGAPGRPSPSVTVRTDGIYVLALDVKVDSVAAATVSLGGHRLASKRVAHPRSRRDISTVLDALAGLGTELMEELPDTQRLVGIGVSIVGLVPRSDAMVEVTPNLGWSDVPLAEALRARLRRRVPIVVSNDGDAGALGERVHGVARGIDDLLYVSGEVGIGGGIIAGGRALGGAVGHAGEIGHTLVDPQGEPCRCGARGCWETVIGEAALLRRAGLPEDGGQRAVSQLRGAALRGDDAALAAMEAVGRWLGLGLAGLVNVLNPQLIVLGGLHGEFHRFLAVSAAEELERNSLVARGSPTEIVPAMFGVDSSLIGAAEDALQPLLRDPMTWPSWNAGDTSPDGFTGAISVG